MIKNNNETIKVSDWSRKYKLGIYAASGAVIVFLGWKIVSLLEQILITLSKILERL